MLVIVWEFRVRPERLSEFLSAYAPGGDWDLLFRRGEGYLSTELLRDERDETRFLTIDRWDSREARDRFRLRFREEYEMLHSEVRGIHARGNARRGFLSHGAGALISLREFSSAPPFGLDSLARARAGTARCGVRAGRNLRLLASFPG